MIFIRCILAEFLGTFWLVFGGCGSVVLAATWTETPYAAVASVGVASAFGIAFLTGAYAFGHISGGHFNPAVTIGLWFGGRTSSWSIVPYILVQVAGAIAAAFALKFIAQDHPGFEVGGFMANGFALLSPGGYSLEACATIEVLSTFFFLIVFIGSTSFRAPAGFAGVAIGLCLTLVHLVSISITNTSVNPARSTGPALVVLLAGDRSYVDQLWLFWAAPIVGAIVAGVIGRVLFSSASKLH